MVIEKCETNIVLTLTNNELKIIGNYVDEIVETLAGRKAIHESMLTQKPPKVSVTKEEWAEMFNEYSGVNKNGRI